MVVLPPFGHIVELDVALVCGHGQERPAQRQQHGVALRLGKGQLTLESPLSGEKRRAKVTYCHPAAESVDPIARFDCRARGLTPPARRFFMTKYASR